MLTKVAEFQNKLAKLPRDKLLTILEEQDPELRMQVNRIEWVFSHKLGHLTWNDGTAITERLVTNEELALLIDPYFEADPDLTRAGLSVDHQRQAFIASDPVLWARHFLRASPRAYQILMLRHPKSRKVLRAGRRLGKSYTLAVLMLHYSFTHNHGRTLVLTPMKSQGEVLYKELLRLANLSDIVNNSISRAITSPYHVIEFINGSVIRFFATGLKSGGKSNVARGQEAHLMILDELDYMGPEDLDAVLAMLQRTDGSQEEKVLVGASTPTGRREKLWEWSTTGVSTGRFKEFWYPSYCNPYFTKDIEQEFRDEYSEMVYRHEIEADWGEELEGAFPRKWVSIACHTHDWEYTPFRDATNSFHIIGVDWDKYGAGVNIVVIEVCDDGYEDERFTGKTRVAYREETIRESFTLTKAVGRIVELNAIFQPRHIYVDRGMGEVQVEMLQQYGMAHPETRLTKRIKGVSFSEVITVFDPVTKQEIRKDIKPYMVENLRLILEREQLLIPSRDEILFRQLIGYVVSRVTETGRPIFAEGEAGDHALDALMLACLALTQNYGELTKLRLARKAVVISNEVFNPTFSLSSDPNERAAEIEIMEDKHGSLSAAPVRRQRTMAMRAKATRTFKRGMF